MNRKSVLTKGLIVSFLLTFGLKKLIAYVSGHVHGGTSANF